MLAVLGAVWVAVWLLVLLPRTEASLVVRVGVGAYLAAGLAMLVFAALGRHEPRWLDWAISASWALGVCGTALYVSLTKAEWGPNSGWARALWSAWLLFLAILPLYWTYKRRRKTVRGEPDRSAGSPTGSSRHRT
jgi:hypothetical protein